MSYAYSTRLRTFRTKIVNITATIVLLGSSMGAGLPLAFSSSVSALSNQTVTPASTLGWKFTTTGDATGQFSTTQRFSTGTGSYELTSTSGKKGYLYDSSYASENLTSLQNISYSYYVASRGAGTSVAPALSLITTINGTWTELKAEPTYTNGAPAGSWQTLDAFASSTKWYSTHDLTDNHGNVVVHKFQGVADLVPWNTLVGLDHSAKLGTDDGADGVRFTFGQNSGGAPWSSFDSFVDNVTIHTHHYDFELPTPTDVYVDPAYTASNPGGHAFGYNAFDTIQEGVNAVATDGTVHVDAANYPESVTVTRPMSLDGAQAHIDARTGRTPVTESTVTGSFTLNADHVTVDGFTVTAPTPFVMLQHNRKQVISNNIIDESGAAISYNSSSDAFSHNLITMNSSSYSGIQANNIPGSYTQITDNTFTGSAPNADADINFIGDASSPVLDVVVQGNQSNNTSGTLVALFNTKRATITGNTAQHENGSVVYIGGNNQKVTVTNNTLTDGATAVNVANNYNDGPNSDVTATQNNFAGSVSGVKVGTGAYTANTPVLATNNWWGNASGPTDGVSGDGSILDKNSNGTGAAAVGAVKYSPWCTTSTCSTDSSVAPGTPTNLTAKFQYDGANLPNGSTINVTAKSGGNNLELQWDTPAGWVNGYHVLTTYPDGSTNVGYQGPNTNAWLLPNGFGQHGQGKYTFQVEAVNDNGTSSPSGTFTLYYDTVSPMANFTITPPRYVNGDFTVAGAASDNVRLSDAFFDVRNGSNWFAGCVSGTFTASPNPIAGNKAASLGCTINTSNFVNGQTYTLRIHASDYAGYGGGQDVPVTFDTTAPVVNVTAPTSGAFVKGTTTVSGTATDNVSGIKNHQVELQLRAPSVYNAANCGANVGSPFYATVQNDGSWSTTFNSAGFTEGKYCINAIAYDGAGNENGNGGTQVKFITIDNTAPVVNDITVTTADGTTENAQGTDLRGNVTFHVSQTETNPNRMYVEYDRLGSDNKWSKLANTGWVSTNSTDLAVDTTKWDDGTYQVKVSTDDAAWNHSGKAVSFTVDNTRPNATITAPANNSFNNTGNFTITGTTTDNLSGIDHVNIYVSIVTAPDSNGKTFGGYVVNNQPASFDPATGDFTYDVSGLAEGTYVIKADAFDKSGNNHFANSVTLTVDTTAPVVALTNPSDGDVLSFTKDGVVDVRGSVTDTNPDHYYWKVTGPNGYKMSKTVNDSSSFTDQSLFAWDLNGLADGQYTLDLEARDAANNKDATSVQTASVTIDNSGPSLTINSYSGTDTTPTITGTTSDPNGIQQVEVSVDGTNYQASVANDGTWSVSVATPLSVGSYPISATSMDTVGNQTTETADLNVTAVTPSGSTTTPATVTHTSFTVTPHNDQTPVVTPHILGDSTTTPSANAVKGASTVTVKNSADKKSDNKPVAHSSNFLGLGWWWLLVLLALLGLLWALFGKHVDTDNQKS